jgi:hypothetical protein
MSGYIIGANLTDAQTSTEITQGKGFTLGDATADQAGNTWVFVQAGGTIASGDTVHISQAFAANAITPALAVTAGQVGFAQYAFAATNYGWVMTTGRPTIRLAAGCADDAPLYTTDTAGVLDDSTVSASQHQVMGVIANGSASAGGVTRVAVSATWPMIRRPAQ